MIDTLTTRMCQAVKKSGKLCSRDASYIRDGFCLCSRHLTRYEKMKTVKVKHKGRTTKIQKEINDEG